MSSESMTAGERIQRDVASVDLKLITIGLGTRLLLDYQCSGVVERAIEIGYRYIDTAPIYGNEAAIGEGLRRSGIAREKMFITTKVEHADLRRVDLFKSVDRSLRELKSDYIDLVLIHWPNADVALEETISAMCELQRQRQIKHIGVANFPIALLDQAIECSAARGSSVAVNQFELHPSLYQARLIEACRERSVSAIAYSPMGRDDLKHPFVLEIASRMGLSPSQIVLRWHFQLGVIPIPIPDTGAVDQIARQFDIVNFDLSEEDMKMLSALSPQTRYFNPAWAPTWDPLV